MKQLLNNTTEIKFDSGKNIFFTSDSHFGHSNIIQFCNRPFANVEEMNEALIENWNSVVGPDDIVFHLGDFAWGGSQVWNSILDRLNGHIYLSVGNHDEKNMRPGYMSKFAHVSYQMHINIENTSIYLNHYPFLTYGGIYRSEPVWQLFGHVHSRNGLSGADTWRLGCLLPTQYDVGVDNNNYTPVSFDKVKEIINQQIAMTQDMRNNNVIKDIEKEHLKLKNDILVRMLTPEQLEKFKEMTTDKGE